MYKECDLNFNNECKVTKLENYGSQIEIFLRSKFTAPDSLTRDCDSSQPWVNRASDTVLDQEKVRKMSRRLLKDYPKVV